MFNISWVLSTLTSKSCPSCWNVELFALFFKVRFWLGTWLNMLNMSNFLGLAQVLPKKVPESLACLTFPRPEADFEIESKNLAFPMCHMMCESISAPKPGDVKLFALLRQKKV